MVPAHPCHQRPADFGCSSDWISPKWVVGGGGFARIQTEVFESLHSICYGLLQ